MTKHQKCGNCRFAEILKPAKEGNTTFAECHNAAPIPSPEDSSSWWPMTDVDSHNAWCGDWAETDKAADKREEASAKRWSAYMKRQVDLMTGSKS